MTVDITLDRAGITLRPKYGLYHPKSAGITLNTVCITLERVNIIATEIDDITLNRVDINLERASIPPQILKYRP